MDKVTEYDGSFLKNYHCEECNWFSNPDKQGLFPVAYEVCPKCGAETEYVTGRFRFKKTERWFATDTIIIGFTKKEVN